MARTKEEIKHDLEASIICVKDLKEQLKELFNHYDDTIIFNEAIIKTLVHGCNFMADNVQKVADRL